MKGMFYTVQRTLTVAWLHQHADRAGAGGLSLFPPRPFALVHVAVTPTRLPRALSAER